jgi:hypothetical protein
MSFKKNSSFGSSNVVYYVVMINNSKFNAVMKLTRDITLYSQPLISRSRHGLQIIVLPIRLIRDPYHLQDCVRRKYTRWWYVKCVNSIASGEGSVR